MAIATLNSALAGCMFAAVDCTKYLAQRTDDDSFKRVVQEDEWDVNNRLGKSLPLREDLYSWALVICFNRDYLAQILFFEKREAEKEKKEDELAEAKK